MSSHKCQRKNSRIVLRRPTAVADLDDALHGASTVGLDGADNCVVVLLHQVALADVVGATFGAENQEPVKPGPVVDLPGIATARVGHLGRARDRVGLRGDAAVEQSCVVKSHDGLLSSECAASPRHDCFGLELRTSWSAWGCFV